MTRALILLFLLTPVAGAQVLTLKEAVTLAENNNRDVQISSIDEVKAREAVAETKTKALPQFSAYILAGEALSPIDFSIPKGALGSFPATGAIPAQNANISTPRSFDGLIYLSAAQPLTQLRKVGLAVRESQLGEKLALESARQSKHDAVHQVKQAYYEIVQLQTQIVSAQSSLKYLSELETVTQRNFEQQTVLRSDVLNVKAKLSQQRYQLLVLQDQLATQKEALNRLLGRDLTIDFSVEEQPVPSAEEMDIAAARKAALTQRSEMIQSGLQTQKTELEIRREHAEYLPDLSLQLSYISVPNVSFLPRNVVSAGFLMQWQPFDWGQKKHNIQQLKGTARQARLTQQDAAQQVLLDVNAKYRKLMESRALLDTQAAVQETEREKLRVLTNQYKEKAALLSDLLQQEASVTQADNQYQYSLAGFWSAKADFDHALGKD